MKKCTCIGAMSGSSGDGLDLAAIEFEFREGVSKLKVSQFRILAADCIPIPDHLKSQLLSPPLSESDQLFRLDTSFGKWIGQEIARFTKVYQLDPLFCAVHGHTVTHKPALGYTLQVGHGSDIAMVSGLPTIVDFRSSDIAAGGQGAPMAPLADRDLFSGYDAYLNIGGIANISYKDADHSYLGFDICPANQLLNALARQEDQPFDRNGFMASTGEMIPDLWKFLGSFPYYKKRPPKTLDNQTIHKRIIESVLKWKGRTNDKLHTCTIHIAERIIDDITHYISPAQRGQIPRVFCTGGGVKNSFLLLNLKRRSKDSIEWVVPDNEIVNYKEAVLFAYAGLLRWHGIPNILASVTGAEKDSIGGSIYLPNKL